jgi:hypothetical protein
MPTSDRDIQRSAHLFIQLHADEAVAKARKGDHERADKWPLIIVAIGELGEPPTDARY